MGVALSASSLRQFSEYLDLLNLWNRSINLTAISDEKDILEKHFADSLSVIRHLPPDLESLVDVGSGAGFPGAVLALLLPHLPITLVEASHKKAAFLSTLRRELGLSRVTVLAARIEEVLAQGSRFPFHGAISRATFPLPSWLALGRRLVRSPGGIILGMEGSSEMPLPSEATRHPVALPAGRRAIIVLRT